MNNKKYKHLFFDLDRTLWDFEANARAAFLDIEQQLNLMKDIPNIDEFINRYEYHNELLWDQYRKGLVKKVHLRTERFLRTLNDFGIDNPQLAETIGDMYLEIAPTKTHLVPGAMETIQYLHHKKYKLHIITNGFKEVQFIKLKSCHLDQFFDLIVTSDDVGSQKPKPEIFAFSLNSRNARKKESLMIGDDFDVDIAGAANYGIDQVYFDISKTNTEPAFQPTYTITELSSLKEFL